MTKVEEELKVTIVALIARIEDIELKQLAPENPIAQLTASNDLEDVKRVVNQIIQTLTKLAD